MSLLITTYEALSLCRVLEPYFVKHNLHIALGGSCLYRGTSTHDIDIFIYERYPGKDNIHIYDKVDNLFKTEKIPDVKHTIHGTESCSGVIQKLVTFNKKEYPVDFFLCHRL